jgi:hypothetical protein
VLTAFEQHWAGRPFVDSIELLAPRAGTPALASAELWETPAGSAGRAAPEGVAEWSSMPAELLAIDSSALDPSVTAALSAAVDRDSLAAVLTQRRAVASASILPSWISGYAFLFSAARDLDRARTLLAANRPGPIRVEFDPSDPLARVVADRVAVNARDAGLMLSVKPGSATVRLRRVPINPNAAYTLMRVVESAGLEGQVRAALTEDPDILYATERIILESGNVLPLMHVPLVFGVHPKVRGLEQQKHTLPRLPLESVWIVP